VDFGAIRNGKGSGNMLSLIYTFGTVAAVAAVAWALIEVWELFGILTEGE